MFATDFVDRGRGILHVGSGVLTGREMIEAESPIASGEAQTGRA